MHQIARTETLSDILEQYNAKMSGGEITLKYNDGTIETIAEYTGVEKEHANFLKQLAAFNTRVTMGVGVSTPISDYNVDGVTQIKRNLNRQAWHKATKLIDKVAGLTTEDKESITRMIEGQCLDFTKENIQDVFGQNAVAGKRQNAIRGLAEVFCKLDPAFKSHDKMKIGVKGLPKRVIFSGYDKFAKADRLMDVFKAVSAIGTLGIPCRNDIYNWISGAAHFDFEGYDMKLFKNGNVHLIFQDIALQDINKALAEFYGDVLADCREDQNAKPKTGSTDVSKDLQFYRTPKKAVEWILGYVRDIPKDARILEPSCGDGAFLDALQGYQVDGIEFDASRVLACRKKGHNVLQANFLEVTPKQEYDLVIMNPPFYGKHYQKHVEHAKKFLKPRGKLFSILPVTAETDHGYTTDGRTIDLPIGSFAESGTNINTILYVWMAK